MVSELGGGAACLAEWRLETGRTHQIRVHAKYIGHPVLGDDTYGGSGRSLLEGLPKLRGNRRDMAEAQGLLLSLLERPCLHAEILG